MFSQFPKDIAPRAIASTILAILVLMPFHGFFSVWIGTSFNVVDAAKIWKEVVLLIVAAIAVYDMYKHPIQRRRFFSSRIHQLIGLYALLHVLMAAVLHPPLEALLVSLILNLRFFLVFMLGRWMMLRTRRTAFVASIMNALGVSMLALLCATTLKDWLVSEEALNRFGYGPDTLPAKYTLDDNDSLIRLSGTTRGPNVFAQLVAAFIVTQYQYFLSLFTEKKLARYSKPHVSIAVLIFIAAVVILFLSYSRSGYVALFIAASILTVLAIPREWRLKVSFAAIPVLFVLSAIVASSTAGSSALRTIILHDDPNTGGEVTSTSKRLDANRAAIDDVAASPFGEGPGTAGPASFYGDQEIRIAENYYLQIAQEVGVVGALLFLTIIVLIAKRMFAQREEFWPKILFALLIGVSFAGLFVHVWADDEVALMFWAVAGMFVRDD